MTLDEFLDEYDLEFHYFNHQILLKDHIRTEFNIRGLYMHDENSTVYNLNGEKYENITHIMPIRCHIPDFENKLNDKIHNNILYIESSIEDKGLIRINVNEKIIIPKEKLFKITLELKL